MPVDTQAAEQATRALLVAIGEDPEREGLRDTPRRVACAWAEFLADRTDECNTTFDEACDEMVVVRDIPFHSFCEHHLLPFMGHAHIAYIPNGRVLGLSKVVRILQAHSRCLQIQERLTNAVADELEQATGATGVAVVLDAEHLCMTLRGVKQPGSHTVTSALRGACRHKPEVRAEAMALCLGR